MTRPGQRLEGLDLARGLAIYGMVLVHFGHTMIRGDESSSALLSWLDGRPATLFMFLAGIGITLLTRSRVAGSADAVATEARPESPDSRALRATLVRRGAFLLGVGFVNLALWPGDILRVYGISFIVAQAFVLSRVRVLLAASLAFFAVFVVLLVLVDYGAHWNWETMQYSGVWTPVGALRNLFYDGFRSVFPWAGVLLLGLAAGRLPLGNARLQRWGLAVGLFVFVGVSLLSSGLLSIALADPEVSTDEELQEVVAALLGVSSMPPLLFFAASSLGAALAALSACLIVERRWPRLWFLRPFVAAGQTAFTLYVGHIYAGVFVVLALGWTVESDLEVWAIASVYFAILASISLLIRLEGKRGPLEALLRRVCG